MTQRSNLAISEAPPSGMRERVGARALDFIDVIAPVELPVTMQLGNAVAGGPVTKFHNLPETFDLCGVSA